MHGRCTELNDGAEAKSRADLQRQSNEQWCEGNARYGIAKAQYGPEQRRNSKDVKCVVAAEKSSPQQGTAVA